jgi:hypothetical protein
MKKIPLMYLFLFCLLFTNCGDPCDEGYKQVNINGQDICLPEYLSGELPNLKLGQEFYHEKFGLIVNKNNNWYNFNGKLLSQKELDLE